MGSSCENPCLVTEIEPPAQQTTPVSVPIVVMVDNAGETQRHVSEKRCILHHMGISCRDLEREKKREREGETGRLIRRNKTEEDNFDGFEDIFVMTKHTERADE